MEQAGEPRVLALPAPNHAVEPTPNSFRSCVASAIGRGSPPPLGAAPIRTREEESTARVLGVALTNI